MGVFHICHICNCYSFAEVLKLFCLFMTIAMSHFEKHFNWCWRWQKAAVTYIVIFDPQVYCHLGKPVPYTVWPNKSLSNIVCFWVLYKQTRQMAKRRHTFWNTTNCVCWQCCYKLLYRLCITLHQATQWAQCDWIWFEIIWNTFPDVCRGFLIPAYVLLNLAFWIWATFLLEFSIWIYFKSIVLMSSWK